VIQLPGDASNQDGKPVSTDPIGDRSPSQSGLRPTSFLEHLLAVELVTDETAVEVTQAVLNGKSKKTVVEILANDFGVDRELLFDEVARFYSFRVISLADRGHRRLGPNAVARVLAGLPRGVTDLALKHKIVPFETAENQGDKILMVTPNPADREVYRVARLFSFKKFEVCYMKEREWDEFWRQVSMEKQSALSGLDMLDQYEPEEDLENLLESEINRGQLVTLIENVLTDAVRVGASDIHVIPKGLRKTSIMFRIDGQLTEWFCVDDARAEAVIAVAKGRGIGLDRFERMAAQDGAAQKIVDDQVIRFRISVLPVISREMGGKLESVVIRLLRDADASVSLETIGFDGYSLRWFREAITKPHGMVILTGPTGCGKSTTLIAALRSVMRPTLNTITVEDPVEYLVEGARQVKLNPKLNFDDALRAILRHDPDIVMVGEIRDQLTADIAVKLANTGHLTFTTLHTNDAPSAVSRLFKIGVEPFLISQALNIVVAQRLLRRLCQHCRAKVNHVDKAFLTRIGLSENDVDSLVLYRAVGCQHCVAGYRGRVAIHESLYITPELREIILDCTDRIDLELIRASAIAHGMKTLRMSGLELVRSGVTTIEEVVSLTVQD
jgi:type IV pilus assembly protein PilB